jgi:hypothetical protein
MENRLMRLDTRRALVVALACGTLGVLGACGSSGTSGPSSTASCAVNVSGPTTISNASCTGPIGPTFDPVGGNASFTLNATMPNGYALAYNIIIKGPFTANATYVVAPTVVSSSMSLSLNNLQTWKGTVFVNAAEDVGTMSLTITSLSSTTQANGLIAYTLHGTINASLPTLQGSGATGTATVNVTF